VDGKKTGAIIIRQILTFFQQFAQLEAAITFAQTNRSPMTFYLWVIGTGLVAKLCHWLDLKKIVHYTELT
jgi:hypothetical protein